MHVPAGRGPALPSLGVLRVLAVCLIFLRHERTSYSVWRDLRIFDIGFVAVSLFFMLSGFVLAWSQREGEATAAFYRKRFARIYPAHLATWLLVFPVYSYFGMHVSAGVAVLSLLLVQAWVPIERVYFGMNGVTWFLSCLAFFYAIYPFVYAKLLSASSRRRWIVAISLVASGAFTSIVTGLTADTGDMASYVNPMVHAGEFVLGIILALELRRGWRSRIHPAPTSILFLAATVGAVVLSMGSGPVFGPTAALMVVPFVLLILLCVQRDLRGAPALFSGPVMSYLAKISFSFFLVHLLVIAFARDFLGRPGTFGEAIPRLIADFGLAVIAASVLHYVVEVPGRRLILRLGRVGGLDAEPEPRPSRGKARPRAA